MELSLVEKAIRIAAKAHEGQKRKEGDIPYIAHSFAVALKLQKYNFPDTVIAAALVHDVLEDTDFSPESLRAQLGEEVYALVAPVTHDDSLSWEEKKKKYIEEVRTAPEGSKAIATADKIHNAESFLFAYDIQGAALWEYFNAGRDKKIWFEEAMLKMLQETWHHPLVDEYAILVDRMKSLS